MAKKKLIGLAEHQRTVAEPAHPAASNIHYLVPTIVGQWGAYVELQAHAVADASYSAESIAESQQAYYRGLADGLARLLALLGVEAVGGDAINAATSRISKTVPAALAVSGRIERLYRAYYLEETDHVRYEAERLWAVLEARSEELAGCPFQTVLAL